MTDKSAVKFLTAHTIGTLYNPNDVAAFDHDTAADLIKRGIAAPAGKKGETAPTNLTAKKVGEGWSVFAGKKELVKGLADKNAAEAWIAEQSVRPVVEARQAGETWSVFAGDDELVKGLADKAAADAWIAEHAKA